MNVWSEGATFLSQATASLPLRHGTESVAATGGLIALVVAVPLFAAALIMPAVGLTRSASRRRRQRTSQLRAATRVEASARALMSELCPYGWRAQITMSGRDESAANGTPVPPRVALDWVELDDCGEVAVERRVWASTIAEALSAMVEDRRTDETLEQIERRAFPKN